MRRTKREPAAADLQSALDAFRRIGQALRMDREPAWPAGVSSAQLFALQQLAAHPGVSINDLAALTFTHQSSVSVAVQRLAEQGLVARFTTLDDRRKQSLKVTARGRRLLDRAPAPVQERLIAAIASLSAADRRALAGSLRRIAEAVSPGQPPPPMFFEDRPPARSRAAPRPRTSSGRRRRRADD